MTEIFASFLGTAIKFLIFLFISWAELYAEEIQRS